MDDSLAPEALTHRLFTGFLRRLHLAAPEDLPGILAEEAAAVGWRHAAAHLVDVEQRRLRPLRVGPPAVSDGLAVEGTLEGQAYANSEILIDGAGPDEARLLVPLLDGTARLGVLELVVPAPGGEVAPGLIAVGESFAHLIAQAIITKRAYGDLFALVHRSEPMSVATELIRGLLPPLLFASRDVVIAGLLEPAYGAGGDSFDYAVNGPVAHLALFDAMGHGLPAAGDASFAVAAYRAARRRKLDLVGTWREMDRAVQRQPGDRFVTAVLAELDLEHGGLRWLSAGHPTPLLVRGGRVVQSLEVAAHPPMGVGLAPGPPEVAHEALRPGDALVFYTDGLTEARLDNGDFFTTERLAAFVEAEAAAGRPPPEKLRRLREAVLAHQSGQLQDDATVVLVEWRSGGGEQLLPTTTSRAR